MKKYEFMEDYGNKKKGEVIEFDMKIYHRRIHPLLMKGILKVVGSESQEPEPNPEKEMKVNLLKKKMNELRNFGRSYDARDTNKEELVDEIIEKAPLDDIKKFMEGD